MLQPYLCLYIHQIHTQHTMCINSSRLYELYVDIDLFINRSTWEINVYSNALHYIGAQERVQQI